MNREVDLDELMLDHMMFRLSLEYIKGDVDTLLEACDEMGLALPVTARDRVQKRLDSIRAALQHSLTLDELGEDCHDCEGDLNSF